MPRKSRVETATKADWSWLTDGIYSSLSKIVGNDEDKLNEVILFLSVSPGNTVNPSYVIQQAKRWYARSLESKSHPKAAREKPLDPDALFYCTGCDAHYTEHDRSQKLEDACIHCERGKSLSRDPGYPDWE